MASRTVPLKWRRAFLRALAVTANVTLSARRAGIDKSTAYQLRKVSPLFDRLWTQALVDGRAALAQGRVPDEATERDSRPLSIRSSKSGRVCVMATGEGRWNAGVETEFFATLAATGNAKAAARAIGMSDTALYNRRKLWPAFDTRWDEVVSLANERLAVQLLTSASNLLDPVDVDVPDFDMSVDQAIRVAQLYEGRRQKDGSLKRYDVKRAPVDVEAVKAEIVRKAALLSRNAPSNG
jgi:hypothetical protein